MNSNSLPSKTDTAKQRLNATALAVGAVMATFASSSVEASWRIEQLQDENGRGYYGWCNDETCPKPSVLRAAPPAPPPVQPAPVPPVGLSDPLPLADTFQRGPVMRPEPAPPRARQESRSTARTGRTGSGAIKRLPETKYSRPIPPGKRGSGYTNTAEELRQIEEARAEALRRSAQRSPVPNKFIGGASSVAPAAVPKPQAPVKQQIILNPGVRSEAPVELLDNVNTASAVKAQEPAVAEKPVFNGLPEFQRLQPGQASVSKLSNLPSGPGYTANGKFIPAAELGNTGAISFERPVQPAKQLVGQTNKVTIILNPGVR